MPAAMVAAMVAAEATAMVAVMVVVAATAAEAAAIDLCQQRAGSVAQLLARLPAELGCR